jgi:hypothetical protein
VRGDNAIASKSFRQDNNDTSLPKEAGIMIEEPGIGGIAGY